MKNITNKLPKSLLNDSSSTHLCSVYHLYSCTRHLAEHAIWSTRFEFCETEDFSRGRITRDEFHLLRPFRAFISEEKNSL